jgi:thioredoxin 1
MIVVNVTELNNSNFENFINDGLSLVDIYADWCGPCKVLSPIIDELSSDYSGQVNFGKLDADKNTEIVKQLGVRNIPTILIYKNGEVVDRTVGMTSKNQLIDLIDKHL